MSRVYGGHWGYRFPRVACPRCGRLTAYSSEPDGRTIWLRSHKPCGRTTADLLAIELDALTDEQRAML